MTAGVYGQTLVQLRKMVLLLSSDVTMPVVMFHEIATAGRKILTIFQLKLSYYIYRASLAIKNFNLFKSLKCSNVSIKYSCITNQCYQMYTLYSLPVYSDLDAH